MDATPAQAHAHRHGVQGVPSATCASTGSLFRMLPLLPSAPQCLSQSGGVILHLWLCRQRQETVPRPEMQYLLFLIRHSGFFSTGSCESSPSSLRSLRIRRSITRSCSCPPRALTTDPATTRQDESTLVPNGVASWKEADEKMQQEK